jgi:hypothetical protein
MIGIGVIGTLMNTYGAKHLPVLEGIVLIVHIFGFFCIIIPLWVLAPKAPASEVFGTFDNFGGWSSIGAACFVGSITATGSFAGSDAAVHLSEETKDASKSVPRMIMFTIVLNGAMGLVFIITYVSCCLVGFHPCWNSWKAKALTLTRSPAVLLHHQPRGCCHVRKSLSLYGCKSLDQPVSTRRKATRSSELTLPTGILCRHKQQSCNRRNVHNPPHPQRLHLFERSRRCISSSMVSRQRSSSALFLLVPPGKCHGSSTADTILNPLTHDRSQTSALPFRSTRSCSLCQFLSSSR